ncbi:MAG: cytochrome-c peroxidase [Arcobacter sp.]|uniref:cytochrome-c peroxidase n=1 Tax=Arcobacter sp. TaxID=1872629 RepID=UPI0025851722|nr:cytochrome-c peroxidase [Arcobacter sp.]MDD3007975.1 cytochrome-c peroxidase [Arcobacter sp.]
MLKIIYFILISSFIMAKEPITPIPLEVKVDIKKANLGKELFFDTILSKDDTISCHSCHLLTQGGDDNLQFSLGIENKIGNLNAPTVLNSTFNFVLFWNGRAKNLQEQALGPITNPIEMGHSFEELIKKLEKTKYKDKFNSIYKDGITSFNITDAIAEYEKTLITPNAPFDRYLRGEKNAISKETKEGYELFKNQGCIACHHGINVGGNLYAKFGVISQLQSDSKGRFEVTKNELDKYYFKVPTLRNIELTAPYLHDGRIDNLEEVVKFMAHYQLGKSLSQEDVNKIVLFLKSLTGEIKNYE